MQYECIPVLGSKVVVFVLLLGTSITSWAWGNFPYPKLALNAKSAIVYNISHNEIIYSKDHTTVRPIASLTKLMLATVIIDEGQPLDELITITKDDIDMLKGTSSRLRIGTTHTRERLLHLTLMSSENRAASALARHYPGGTLSAVDEMNVKAITLGMYDTRYEDPTGLDDRNVSTSKDLTRLVRVAFNYPLITTFSTYSSFVQVGSQSYSNSNSLTLSRIDPNIVTVSKTGYINRAGRCVVLALSDNIVIVLLGNRSVQHRINDVSIIMNYLNKRNLI